MRIETNSFDTLDLASLDTLEEVTIEETRLIHYAGRDYRVCITRSGLVGELRAEQALLRGIQPEYIEALVFNTNDRLFQGDPKQQRRLVILSESLTPCFHQGMFFGQETLKTNSECRTLQKEHEKRVFESMAAVGRAESERFRAQGFDPAKLARRSSHD